MRAIFILTAVMGAALVLYALTQLGQELRSNGWRAVPAEIVQSDVVIYEPSSAIRRKTLPGAHFDLAYSYRIDGFDYKFGQTYLRGSPEDMQTAAARYPLGGSLTVYVSPEDPAMAVLERGVSGLAVIMLLAGSLGLAASTWFWRGLRPHVRPSQRRKLG